MPVNHFLGGLLNFLMPKSTPPLGPGRAGGYPGLGGPIGGFPGFRPPYPPPQGGGLFGPKMGGGMPKVPGGGLPSLPGAGGGGLGDLFSLLRSVDIGKVVEGLNAFQTTLGNIQKIAQTINQLGTIAGNLNQIMKNVDIHSLLSMLQPSEGGTGEEGTGEKLLTPPESPDNEVPGATNVHLRIKKKRRKKKKAPSIKSTAMRNSPLFIPTEGSSARKRKRR